MLNFKNGLVTLMVQLNPSQRGSRSLPSPVHSTAWWEELQASGARGFGLVWHHAVSLVPGLGGLGLASHHGHESEVPMLGEARGCPQRWRQGIHLPKNNLRACGQGGGEAHVTGSNLEHFLVEEVGLPRKCLHFSCRSGLFLYLMALVLASCLPLPAFVSPLQIPSSAQFP